MLNIYKENVILSRLGQLMKSLLNLQSCFLGYELEFSVGIPENLRADINKTTLYKHVVKARPSQPNELLVLFLLIFCFHLIHDEENIHITFNHSDLCLN